MVACGATCVPARMMSLLRDLLPSVLVGSTRVRSARPRGGSLERWIIRQILPGYHALKLPHDVDLQRVAHIFRELVCGGDGFENIEYVLIFMELNKHLLVFEFHA